MWMECGHADMNIKVLSLLVKFLPMKRRIGISNQSPSSSIIVSYNAGQQK